MESQKQIHCIASNSYGTTGMHQNLLEDLRKSSTAQNTATEILRYVIDSLSGKPNKKVRRNSTLLRQSKNSGDMLLVTIL